MFFFQCFLYSLKSSNQIFKTGNGIIQTGNGIISPTSRPLIKKLVLQHLLHITQEAQNWFSKQEMELSKQEMELTKQEMELFLPLLGLWSKNFFYKMFTFFQRSLRLIFKTGNGIISPTFRPMIKKLLLQKFSHFQQGVQIDFQNRKRNYLNRKRNYLSYFRASDQKTSFTRCFTFFQRSLRLIFKTGKGII